MERAVPVSSAGAAHRGQVHRNYPALAQTRILFMSGYTADVIAHRGVLDADLEYLPKPFTPDSLARKIREILPHKTDTSADAT